MTTNPRHFERPKPNIRTMKGRSANKLLGKVEACHGELSRARCIVFQTWPPCGVRGWELEDEIPALGKMRWALQELLSSWELVAEGRAIHHCVGSSSVQSAAGNTAMLTPENNLQVSFAPIAWSPDGTHLAMLGIEYDKENQPHNLWVIDADGADLHKVIDFFNQPSWIQQKVSTGATGTLWKFKRMVAYNF